MLQATVETRVRFAETDAMGVTYHGNYLPWFEMARVALLDQLGTPYRQLEQEGFLLPVLETGLTYHRPSRFDDRVRITVTLAEKPKARLKLTYQVEPGQSKQIAFPSDGPFDKRLGYVQLPMMQERLLQR